MTNRRIPNEPPEPAPVDYGTSGETRRSRSGKGRAAPAAAKGRYVPADVDAERAVVAALLTSPHAFDEVANLLAVEDFTDPGLGACYAAVMACEASGRPIDQITVADELRRAKQLTRVGGPEGLAAIVESAQSMAGNVEAHAEIVEGKARLRRIIEAGQVMAGAAMAPDADPIEVRQQAEALVFDLGRERQNGSMVTMAEAVPKMLSELAKTRNQLLLGHSTGFADLDKLTGGFQGGQLIVLAARPSMGKSAMALQMARHIAETTGLLVPFLSYEMSQVELTTRMLSSALRFDVMALRQGQMPEGMDRDLAVAAEKMAALPLLIDDNPPATIAGVRSAMRRLARRGQIGAIFVDYLQLMESDRRSRDANRVQEVSDISRGLKRLASELDVPVVALSQLSRNLEARPNKRPILSDLRESGSIEQDASCVGFIFRESVYSPTADDTLAELIIAKQRSGACGTVHLEWDGPSTRFATTQRRPVQADPGPGASGGGRGGSYF